MIFTILIFISLVNFISFKTSAITVNPGTYFPVGNEKYTVNQTMNFESILVGTTHIVFNDTGFYITSENNITINLVFINEDITSIENGEKALEFYADTTSGIVGFNISGFTGGNDYLVNRSGSPIDIATADGSGHITFINKVWNNYLFEIYKWGGSTGNNTPVVSDIPDQMILQGAGFNQIDLDSYVFDLEDPDENITWTYEGNSNLSVSINANRIATISYTSGWKGVETIMFTAEDTDGQTDSDNATFMVIENDAPFFSDLSISDGEKDVPISTSSLRITIEDPDGDSIDWNIRTSPNIGSSYGNSEYNGSKSCSISDLAYSQTYHWSVSATDGIYWTNETYSFTTEAGPPDNPPGPPPSVSTELDFIPEINNPPDIPIKPSGPTFIELGVEYEYSTSTVDDDGNQVRFRFDWGDGNYSDWSEFVTSNVSVAMSHSWDSISNFKIRVIAQDENGLNSSWSPHLNITVSQDEVEGEPPVAIFALPGKISTNQTLFFDGSASFDIDGEIISYWWDFGDGENGSGVSLSHIYKIPGEYTVTLIVKDEYGNTYSKSTIITVVSESKGSQREEKKGALPFDYGIIIFVCIIILLFLVIIFFKRDTIKSFVSTFQFPDILQWKVLNTKHRLEKIDLKIEELRNKMVFNADFNLSPVEMRETYSEKIRETSTGINGHINSEIASTTEEKSVVAKSDIDDIEKKVDDIMISRLREIIDKL